MINKKLTIGYLAKLANINVETIRFYQKKGLIQQPPKPVQGYRIYSENSLAQLLFIQRAKLVGFTLAEIKNLLALGEHKNCEKMLNLTQQKLALINHKLADLTELKKTLETLIINCKNRQPIDECPIITTFKNKF
jgi:MerR family mercuric resistance operon transcriptional regulator